MGITLRLRITVQLRMTALLNMHEEALSGREQKAVGYFAFIRVRRFKRDSGSIADFHNHFSLLQLL